MSNFITIRPVGTELFHTDKTGGWTDMTKLIDTCRNFANTHKTYTKEICGKQLMDELMQGEGDMYSKNAIQCWWYLGHMCLEVFICFNNDF
jgi:hypothetical protein